MNSIKNNRREWMAGVAIAAAIGAGASGGALGGPGIGGGQVLAHSTDVYEVPFRAGEPARIAVSGDGDTDLDLMVYDSNGRLVASDLDGSDDCLVEWMPTSTMIYTIKVKNYGSVYNQYLIGHN